MRLKRIPHVIPGSSRTQIFLVICSVLMPILLANIWLDLEYRSEEIERKHSSIVSLAHALAGHVKQAVGTAEDLLKVTAVSLSGPRGFDPRHAAETLRRVTDRIPLFESLLVADHHGRVISMSREAPCGLSFLADQPFFREALVTRNLSIGDYAECPSTGNPVLYMALPVIDRGTGVVRFLLVAGLNVRSMFANIGQIELPPFVLIGFADRKGIRFHRYPEADDTKKFQGSAVPADTMKRLQGGEERGAYEGMGSDGVTRIYGYHQLRHAARQEPYGLIYVGVEKNTVVTAADRMTLRHFYVAALAGGVSFLVALILGEYAVRRPIKKLSTVIREIGEQRFDAKCGIGYDEGELGEMARSIDEAARTLGEKSEILRQEKEELRKSEQRYRDMVEVHPDMVCRWRTDRTLTYVNEAYSKFFKKNASEIHGIQWIELIPEEARRRVHEFYEVITRGPVPVTYEHAVSGGEGATRWVQWRDVPIFDGAGGLVEFQSAGRDVTESKCAQDKLEKHADFLEVLLDTIPLPVFYKGMDGLYRGCNESFARAMGRSKSEIIGKSIWDLAPRELAMRYEEMDRELIAKGSRGVQTYDSRVRFADGSLREVVFHKAVYPGPDGEPSGLIGIFVDVTERNKAAAEVREREERYRSLFETSSDAVFLLDDEHCVDCNPAAERMFGYKREKLLGKLPLYHSPTSQPGGETSTDMGRRFMTRALNGESMRFEWRHRRADGSEFDAEVTLSRITLKGGMYLQAVIRDVTERNKAEAMYRSLAEHSAAGASIIQHGVFKYVNPIGGIYAGRTPSSLIGLSAFSIVHPEDREKIHTAFIAMVRGERTSPVLFRIMQPDGSVVHLIGSAATICYEGERATLLHTFDVTELAEAKKLLADERARVDSVLTAIPHAVLGIRGSSIFFANEAAERLFDLPRERLMGASAAEILGRSGDRCEVMERIGRFFSRGEMHREGFEIEMADSAGRTFTCRVAAAPILVEHVHQDREFVLVLEDMTAWKQMQLRLMHTDKMASIGQLAAGVAHEINNPTGYVSSNLKTLAEYCGDIETLFGAYRELMGLLEGFPKGHGLPAEIERSVAKIHEMEKQVDLEGMLEDLPSLIRESQEGARRIREIVLDLKNFAHPGEDAFSRADINQNLDSTLNVVWNELKYKAVVKRDYGDLPEVECSVREINQVFMNLLVNAAQAIDEQGEIEIRTRSEGDHVSVSISDTGCGIPEENLMKIFDPFFTTKEPGKGTGLGLHVVYGIVKKHRGTIDVRSRVGEGTTFMLRLPVHRVRQTLQIEEGMHAGDAHGEDAAARG